MASTSASSVQKSFKYDAFLSFRGEDTRKNFVDHLYHALHQKGIITYKDDESIEKGERIDDQLFTSIEDSRFHIIVFSKNYASSSWCLKELVKIMECQKMSEHTAYPIFFDVEPTEVRNQSGSVGEAFAKHENEEFTRKRKRTLEDADLEKEDDVGRWRNALKEAGGLAGMELKNTFNGHEAKFIQKIVVDISLKLSFINWRVDTDLVGMETRVENVVSSLKIGPEDVRMIGIWGMGGGGKTTLATAVYDRISDWFEGTSFVENVREVSKSSLSGLKELQKQVLSDVLSDQSIVVRSVSDGKNKMIKMMSSRKVLVVLDDVDNISQLEALVGKPDWFKPGSRIIITTRDEQVLVAHGVHSDHIHDVNLLKHEEAICLFSRYAFKREIPSQGYEELSRIVVHYAAGLPLTVKVLGSHLCGRSELEWVDTIKRLKTIPLKETLKRLEISYDGLEDDQKEIFLDVACIVKGEMRDKAIKILESCGFSAEIGLRVLEQKSLITITSYNSLSCHDHIEEMGWNIVRRLHPDEPYRHSRLWVREEIEDILVNELGTEAIRSIKLQYPNLHPATIMKGLRNMGKLRYLNMSSAYKSWKVDEETIYDDNGDHNDDGDKDDDDDDDKYIDTSHYLPDALRYLYWNDYHFCSLPKTFQASELVNLEMVGSNISELWEGGERKVLKNLRFLDLKHSKLRTFDLGLTPRIQELNLVGCKDFVQLLLPFECSNLKSINLSNTKVSYLNLGMTPHLEHLDLSKCYSLQEIHAPVGCLKNMYFLDLSGCMRFQRFLIDTTYKSGATLILTAESLDECPLHPNSNLPKFEFKCKYSETLPSSSGNLEKLISFGLCACTNLETFSASISGLQHLKELTLEGSIPKAFFNDLYRLEGLKSLTLSMEEIKHLPYGIYMLKHLKSLKLNSCTHLEHIPENICRLDCLEELGLSGCKSLRDIPNNICKMKCLKRLDLFNCILVEKLPEELGDLECLEEINIHNAGISCLPQSIYQLKGLRIIGYSEQLKSYGFTSLKTGYTGFYYYYVQL